MKTLLTLLCLALSVAAVPAAEKKSDLKVLVSADAIPSPEGFRPKPNQPVHYIFNQTWASLGEAVADKRPDTALIESAVVAELAKQGFVRSELGGPIPSIYIVAVVGDANFAEPPLDEFDFMMYEPMISDAKRREIEFMSAGDPRQRAELIEEEVYRLRYRGGPRQRDRAKINNLIGADKVEAALAKREISSTSAEEIAWAGWEDRYYISLNAFDAARWKKNEKVLLWRTTMSIDARKGLAKSLTEMLSIAGPTIATDSPIPVYVDDRTGKSATVEVGDIKVVPDAEKAPEAEAKSPKK